MRSIFVTGAGGFVGRALCESLVQRGYAVQGGVRDGRAPLPDGVRVGAMGDLAASADWRPLLAGMDSVVHLAAQVHRPDQATLETCRRINVEATRRLAEQAVEAGVRRFVFLSTVKVLGEESPARSFNDGDRPAPHDAYALSKYEAEQVLFELTARSGLEVVVLRPPLVYGPGVKANFLALMDWLAKGRPLPIGALKNRRSFCYLGNLCDAILTAVEHPAAANRTFLVGDAETLALKDFVGLLARALGRPAHLWPVPAAWLEAGGGVLGKGDSVRRLTRSLEIDVSGIREALGWQPPCAIDVGLARTAEDYRTRSRGT